MHLKVLAPNMTELHAGDAVILFSYEVPVAARVGSNYYRTSKKYSVTTSRHISKWLGGVEAEVVGQEFITRLTCPVEYEQ